MLVFLFPPRLASGSGSGRPQGSSKERSLSAAPSEAALRCLPRLGLLATVTSLLLGDRTQQALHGRGRGWGTRLLVTAGMPLWRPSHASFCVEGGALRWC